MVIELTGFGLDRSGMDLFRSNYAMLNYRRPGLSSSTPSSARYRTRSDAYFNDFNNTKLVHATDIIPADTITTVTPQLLRNLKTSTAGLPLTPCSFQDKSTTINRALNFARDGTAFMTEKSESLHAGGQKPHKVPRRSCTRQYTLPIACLVFFFIGAPLGAIIRKGGLGTPGSNLGALLRGLLCHYR
ncbi:MAG: LptF/LptG family permease [Marinilabiliales bacterium]|nr:LptF/LptG family permease [Marinilabiliales bacterium]